MKSPKSPRMPVLFIGHGSPMNAVMRNGYTDSLRKLGKDIPRPKAVLVVSAHWLTRGTFVTCESNPKQIYDFYGFPDALYQIRYRPNGAPDIARRVIQVVKKTAMRCENAWGLDHASWAVLHHMFPDADVPVIEMSLDVSLDEQSHYELAGELSDLRKEGVLIIGSGNIVHNLRILDADMHAPPLDWAVEFDEWVKARLLGGERESLLRPYEQGRSAALSIPTDDHYLPMLYAIALRQEGESVRFVYEGFQHGTISMRCFQIG